MGDSPGVGQLTTGRGDLLLLVLCREAAAVFTGENRLFCNKISVAACSVAAWWVQDIPG
jgi:hypothetical protein